MDAGSLTAPKAKVDAVQSSAGVQDRSHVLAVAGVHTRILLSAIIILRRDPIGNLFGTISVDIVAVAAGGAALRQRRKLPPVLPRQRHAPVAQRIPDGIVGDRLPVVAGQQVLPARVPVGVAHRLGRRSQRTRRVGVLLLRRDVPSVVVGVGDALVLPHAVHPR